MTEHLQSQEGHIEDSWIARAEARIVGYDDALEPLSVQAGKPYELEVSVTSLPSLGEYPALMGKEVDVFVHTVAGAVSPDSASIKIPEPDDSVSESFEFILEANPELTSRDLHILLFHKNYLLRHMEMGLQVSQ